MTEEEFQQLLDQYLEDPAKQPESQWFHGFIEKMAARSEGLSLAEHARVSQELLGRIKAQLRQKPVPIRQLGRRRTWWVAAALLLLGSLVAAWLQLKPYFTTVTVATRWGQQDTILLADGSRVILNVGSTLQFPQKFWPGERRLQLVGEAFFAVKKNAQQPFVVASGAVETTVLGTSFNVSAYRGEDIAVTVFTGKVAMRIPQANKPLTLLLAPRQRGIYQPRALRLQKTELKDLAAAMAWRQGYLVFDEATLSTVMATLARWYGIDLQCPNPALRSCQLTGQFPGNNLPQALESIGFITGSQWKKVGSRQYLLSGKGCLRE